jgi:signal transduction histidine kinase
LPLTAYLFVVAIVYSGSVRSSNHLPSMKRTLTWLLYMDFLLIGISFASAILFFQTAYNNQLVKNSLRILYRGSDLYSALQDMNIYSRGYLLTKDNSQLARYYKTKKEYPEILKNLDQLVSDDDVLQADVRQLVKTAPYFGTMCEDLFKVYDGKTGALILKQITVMDLIRQSLESIAFEERRRTDADKARVVAFENVAWSALAIQVAAGLFLLYRTSQSIKSYDDENKAKIVELLRVKEEAVTAKTVAEHSLEVKSRFLSTLSHEVRTPMTAIIGLAELLSLDKFDQSTTCKIDGILESSQRLLQMLNNVLDTAKLEAGKVTFQISAFPIRAMLGEIRQLVNPAAESKGLHVTALCDKEIPEYVSGDELRVRQVLLNLAFNAVKYTQKGHVDITASLKEHNDNQTVVRFEVTDTGIGIEGEMQERIFKPFEQLSHTTTLVDGGSGLGLSISKELVELMDGTIGVNSEAGRGSTFWFQLPFTQTSVP